ncbi:MULTISPECIES: phage holin family protein [Nitrosomonas]|uniref:Putative superfamily III holin-X n=1 Tax=Nitrosomonas communis TaxID=44574 RepID=A0A5D3YAX6_9PROT|nr:MULTISPECIES: phage holin family protein [Nitrosomonas]TYP86659.1 putative superfamily III holin-X [Nitrosomonas communis]UVS62051.1 phage holin family protein [Nitrosomonas sp. PLL12]
MLPKLVGDILATEYAKLRRSTLRLALIISLLGLAVIVVMIGMIFILFGLYVSLAETMKPWEAAVIVGGGVVFVASILILIIVRQGRVAPNIGSPVSEQSNPGSLAASVKDLTSKQSEKIADLAENTGESVEKYIRKRPLTTALIAFGGGFVVSMLLRNNKHKR